MKVFRIALLLCLVVMVLGASDCDSNTANDTQEKQMRQTLTEAESRVGPPGITNYTERRFFKQILELRDSEITTWSYYMDLTGNLHFLCQSIGYGLPYSTQYTNPEMELDGYQSITTLPQVDPNGLYMPDGVAATWITCVGNKGKPEVVYWEPDLVVSPFELAATTSLRKQAKK